MTNCPPVLIAQALVTELQAATTFSLPFECRASLGDFPEKLEDTALDTPQVDVILWPKPTMDLAGRFFYAHGDRITVALRQKLNSGRCLPNGSFDLSELAPLLNLFYELVNFILPSSTNPMGRRLALGAATATFAPPVDIVKLWDSDLLMQAKQYCGIFRAPFRYIEAGQ